MFIYINIYLEIYIIFRLRIHITDDDKYIIYIRLAFMFSQLNLRGEFRDIILVNIIILS